jgi:hypothetical protein
MYRTSAREQIEAAFCRKVYEMSGDARLYQLSHSIQFHQWHGRSAEIRTTNYVVVSAIYNRFSGNETLIFPANSGGIVLDWCELDGSFSGSKDHEQAIANAGWRLVDNLREALSIPSQRLAILFVSIGHRAL